MFQNKTAFTYTSKNTYFDYSRNTFCFLILGDNRNQILSKQLILPSKQWLETTQYVPVGPHTFIWNTSEIKLKPAAGLLDETCVRWGLKTVMAASLNWAQNKSKCSFRQFQLVLTNPMFVSRAKRGHAMAVSWGQWQSQFKHPGVGNGSEVTRKKNSRAVRLETHLKLSPSTSP